MADVVRGVYLITCLANGRVYVGSAADVEQRRRAHYTALRHFRHHNRRLQRAWNKYGADVFMWSLAVEMPDASAQELVDMEAQIIMMMVDVFNVAAPGLAPWAGRRHSDATKAKMSEAAQRMMSPERRAKIGAAQRGKVMSPETRAKIGAAHKDKINTPSARAKMSAARTGKKHTAETRAKISAAARARHG